MAMGRPQKPFKTSWGDLIPGLYRCPDGRWRINLTGAKFTEPDERRAVQRYRDWMAENAPEKTVNIAGNYQPDLKPLALEASVNGMPMPPAIVETLMADPNVPPSTTYGAGYSLPESIVWPWLREQLITRPEYVAKMTGIPEIAALRHLPTPKPPLKLADLLAVYREHADVKADTKREAAKTFADFLEITGATTLADLTSEALTAYRDEIRQRVKSPGTVAAYFGRVKWIIAFAKSEGRDVTQIDAALSRMAVLKAPKDRRTHQPTPVSPDDFRKLLDAAEREFPAWRARLLVMLNLCLHFDECLDLEWGDFDLDKGTFCTNRNKRGRVIRAATLWPETITSLRGIDRTGSPYVFVSAHGGRYNAKGQWKTWEKLRTAAGCPDVQLDDIRDGGYTAACNASGVDEKFARLLAGHRSHGLQDNYVSRNPSIVRPACEAAYKAYAPFTG